MSKVLIRALATSVLALGLATPGLAQKSASGSVNGLNWKAESRIVGKTSTATLAAGGNPAYLAAGGNNTGVVALIMEYANGDAFICSGSLLNDRKSILTAGHCVSGGAGTANPVRTTAYFHDGSVADPFFNQTANTIEVASYFVNAGYTGEVIDQNDIAVLRLKDVAPNFAKSYAISTDSDLTGDNLHVVGWGGRSTVGGAVGTTPGTGPGRVRQGDNRYDFRLGDSDFGNYFDNFSNADYDFSYLSDFDSGLAANDASCMVAADAGIGANAKYCNLGVGDLEVGVAGGDSGGPQFLNGKISSVTSYGLTFFGLGDIDCLNAQLCNLNSSFGEFSGYVPTFIHSQFITDAQLAAIPEPASWAMMIMGFGLAGVATRRVRSSKVSFA
jgi:hypothetical protein